MAIRRRSKSGTGTRTRTKVKTTSGTPIKRPPRKTRK